MQSWVMSRAARCGASPLAARRVYSRGCGSAVLGHASCWSTETYRAASMVSAALRGCYRTCTTSGRGPAGSSEEEDDVWRTPSFNMGQEGGEMMSGSSAPSLRSALPPSDVELPESTFLKCIEKEIMDEKLRLDKEEGPPQVPTGWTMYHAEGTSLLYGRRMWLPSPTVPSASTTDTTTSAPRMMEKHFVRLQLTTRDASLDPECDVRGEHFPFSFFVQRVPISSEVAHSTAPAGESNDVLPPRSVVNSFTEEEEMSLFENSIEVRCDVVDGELVIDNIRFHGVFPGEGPMWASRVAPSTDSSAEEQTAERQETIYHNNLFGGYPGPNLDEAEEEVLDSLQTWMAERGIDDLFGEFMGQYAIWIEQEEYERWLQHLHDYVAA